MPNKIDHENADQLAADLLRKSKNAAQHLELKDCPLHSSDVAAPLYYERGLPK